MSSILTCVHFGSTDNDISEQLSQHVSRKDFYLIVSVSLYCVMFTNRIGLRIRVGPGQIGHLATYGFKSRPGQLGQSGVIARVDGGRNALSGNKPNRANGFNST